MKVGMIAWGTDGDIEPFVALAIELVKRKHIVSVFVISVKNRDYRFLNQEYGIQITQKKYTFHEKKEGLKGIEIWKGNGEEKNDILEKRYRYIENDLILASTEMCKTSEIVVGNQHTFPLICISEKTNIPYVSLSWEHSLIRSDEFPPGGFPETSIEMNRKYWDQVAGYVNTLYLDYVNILRKECGIQPVKSVLDEILFSKFLNLVSYSKNLVGKNPSDWEGRHYTCGYLNPPNKYSNWEKPESLTKFIRKGEKPVFISLGNMYIYEKDISVPQQIIIDAIQKAKTRAIFLSKWDDNSPEYEDIYKLSGFISYNKVLPFCSLMIHHGGTGTIHYAASNGCPSIVIPYGMDQPYNASILENAGICSEIIHRKDINAEKLSNAIIRALKDNALTKNAQTLAEKMKDEDGAKLAADLMEKKFATISKN